jgi:hypothetical protein
VNGEVRILELLPVMETNVSIYKVDRHIILDTKQTPHKRREPMLNLIVAMHKHAYHVMACGSFGAETFA